MTNRVSAVRLAASGLLLTAAAVYFCLAPLAVIVAALLDPGVATGRGTPELVWRTHRSLTPRFAAWAQQRVEHAAGERVSHEDVLASEWPMFGSVFYLAATEHLQRATEAESRSGELPRVYARQAIDAAAALLVDPANATWVRTKWGANYLHHENVFYRMLLIRGLTSHAQLTGSAQHLALLRDQTETLAAELLAAPSGFLNDYPNEAYPSDVLWAVAAIRAADGVLGTDHQALVQRFVGLVQAPAALGRRGLPPYQIDARRGVAYDDSRGCANSGILIYTADLSPELAERWYDLYVQHFWQERFGAIGFREFAHDIDVERWWDVDAGPVVFGYGFAATAFGIGAARSLGRFDHAVPLAALAAAASWPLPDGTLLLPRLLSHATEAPFLGEAALLFILTRPLAAEVSPRAPGHYPSLLYVILAAYAGVATSLLRTAWLHRRSWRLLRDGDKGLRFGGLANAVWCAGVVLAAVALLSGRWAWVAIALCSAIALPLRLTGKADPS